MTKIPPPKKSGILARYCKNCGDPHDNKGRLCRECKKLNKSTAKEEWRKRNKDKEKVRLSLWSKNNVQKNRDKALLHLRKKRLLFHLGRIRQKLGPPAVDPELATF